MRVAHPLQNKLTFVLRVQRPHQDVVRFQVSVYDAYTMYILQGLGHLDEKGENKPRSSRSWPIPP